MPDHIIGISAYDDSYITAQPVFAQQLLGLVKFDSTSDEWEVQIRKHVCHILASTQSTFDPSTEAYNYDLGIVCALYVELESVKNLVPNWETVKVPGDNSTYYINTFEENDRKIRVVATSASQMGMTASAVSAMKLIQHFRPYYLAMTGIAAGVREKVNMGDVLVADPSWDYGSGKLVRMEDGERVLAPDPLQIRLDGDIRSTIEWLKNDSVTLNKIRSDWRGPKPSSALNIHIGPVGSGAAVLSDGTVIQEVKSQNRKVIGIEMETYGTLYAAQSCTNPRPTAFSLKSVCDFGDEHKDDDYQHYAAYTSASVLYYLAINLLDFSGKNS